MEEKNRVVKCERGDRCTHLHAATQGLLEQDTSAQGVCRNRGQLSPLCHLRVQQGHLWEQLDLAEGFLSLKKIGLIPDLTFETRKKAASLIASKSCSQAPTTAAFRNWGTQ